MAKLGNLASRVLVAVIAAPLLLLVIYQESSIPTWALVFAASLLTMNEFFAMTLSDRTDRIVSLLLGAGAVSALYWLSGETEFALDGPLLALLIATVGPLLYYLMRFGDMSTAAARVAYSTSGIVYAGVLVTFIAFVRRDFGYDNHQVAGHLVILLLLTAWLADTGGYFAGKALGKRKLYPDVSPNKTWAGAIGGTLCSIGGGVAFKLTLLEHMTWLDIVLLTGCGSILGQLGDLAESMIKRSVGVKDSGALLPGHGGILDRVDAVILIAPYYYVYLSLVAA